MGVDNETSGTAKGSLKDRIHVLNILLRISRRKKLRCQFKNINTNLILNIKKITPFFYMPVKYVVDSKLRTTKLELYEGITYPLKYKISKRKQKHQKIEPNIVQVRKFGKGIGPLEEIIKNNNETHTFPIVDDLPEKTSVINYIESNALDNDITTEYAEIYSIPKQDLNMDLVYNVLMMRCCSEVLFAQKIADEEIKDFVIAQIEINELVKEVFEKDETETIFEGIENETEQIVFKKDIVKPVPKEVEILDDDSIDEQANNLTNKKKFEEKVINSEKVLQEINRTLEKQTKNFNYIEKHINDYSVKIITDCQINGLGKAFCNALGVGLGILTLPFSRIGSMVLGTKLINNSVKKMQNSISIDEKEIKVNNYVVKKEDIDRSSSCIRTSSFLMSDTLEQLKKLKFDLKFHKDDIPDYRKFIKRIELLEKGLSLKQIKLQELEQSLEKSKVKVLERKIA